MADKLSRLLYTKWMEYSRKEKMTKHLNLNGTGLEIGPLCWPILTPEEAKIYYADHTTTDGLRKIYKGDKGVPSDQIVEVKYPLNGRSLLETVKKQRFEFILASHVIEHVPDIIDWLNDMANVLKPGGVLSLAIPDKRFTFDIDRNTSRISDAIGVHLDGLKKPSSVTVFDHFINYRDKIDPGQAWNGQVYASEMTAPHRYSAKQALQYCKINRDSDEYVDTHTFVFTPSSFVELLRNLIDLSLVPFAVSDFDDTAKGEYEFFISLQKIQSKDRNKALDTLPNLPTDPTLRVLQKQLSQLEYELLIIEQDRKNIYNSLSWRITRPLRLLRKLFTKA